MNCEIINKAILSFFDLFLLGHDLVSFLRTGGEDLCFERTSFEFRSDVVWDAQGSRDGGQVCDSSGCRFF